MGKYISKSALVAEIESKIEKYTKRGEESDAKRDGYGMYWGGVISCLNEVRTLCDTLEVKEVYLDEEIKEEYLKRRCYGGRDNMLVILSESQFNKIAKHFFELGLRSTITEEDCKLIWNIGDEIPNMPEEEFFKELLKRFKAQKGEGI